jgi:hypothetical protein
LQESPVKPGEMLLCSQSPVVSRSNRRKRKSLAQKKLRRFPELRTVELNEDG